MLVCREKLGVLSAQNRARGNLLIVAHHPSAQDASVFVTEKLVTDPQAVAPTTSAATINANSRASHAKQLTSHLSRCSSLAEVLHTCLSSQQQLNAIHISAALHRCVHLAHKQQRARLQQPQLQLHQQQEPAGFGSQCQLQHPVDETLVHYPHQPTRRLQQLHKFVSWAVQQLLCVSHLCSSREISSTLWCCSQLRYCPEPRMMDRLLSRFADLLPGSSCQAMSVVLYSLAKLGYSPSQQWLDQLLFAMFKAVAAAQWANQPYLTIHAYQQSHDKQQEQPQPSSEPLYSKHTHLQEHLQIQPHFKDHQQLQCFLQQSNSSSNQSHLLQQQQQLDPGIGQVLSNAMWSLTRFQQPTVAEVWMLPLLSLLCLQQQQQVPLQTASQVTMQSVANSLWACGQLLSIRPQQQQHCSLGSALLQQHWQQELGILWGNSRPQHDQAALIAAVRLKAASLLESSVQLLHTAQPSELAMLLQSCVTLELAPSKKWQQQFWAVSEAALRRSPDSFNMFECTTLLSTAAYLRLQPTGRWFAALLMVLRPRLKAATAIQLARMIWAVGVLRARPSVDWMSAVVGEFADRIKQHPGCVSPTAVHLLVWGAAKVGYQLPTAVMELLLKAVQDDLASYGSLELSKLLHGCSVLGVDLPDSWLSSVLAAFVQQLGQTTAADITMMLRALADLPVRQRECLLETVMQQDQVADSGISAAATGRTCSPGVVDQRMAEVISSSTSNDASRGVGQQGQQPPGCCYLVALTERAEQLLGYMTAVELCQTLHAVAQLGAVINPSVWSQAVNYTLPQQMHLLAPGDLCLLLYSLAKMQHAVQMKRPLHKRLLVHSHRLMVAGRFKPRDLTAFVWNYSRVCQGSSAGLQHTGLPRAWVTAFSAAATMQLHHFTGRQLGVMLKGLLLLGVVLDQQFVDTVSSVLEWQSAKYSKYELAKVSSLLLELQQVELAASAYSETSQEEEVGENMSAVTAAVRHVAAGPMNAIRPDSPAAATVAVEHAAVYPEAGDLQESAIANIMTTRVRAGASVASLPAVRRSAAVAVRAVGPTARS